MYKYSIRFFGEALRASAERRAGPDALPFALRAAPGGMDSEALRASEFGSACAWCGEGGISELRSENLEVKPCGLRSETGRNY